MDLSIIIPIYNEPFAQKTIDTLLERSKGNIEIIAVIDGTNEKIKIHKKVKTIYLKGNDGYRRPIDIGVKNASGEYIMKLDAHCLVANGFDEILKRDCKDNWLMVPRRYPLNLEWKRGTGSSIKDYHYWEYSPDKAYPPQSWYEMNVIRKGYVIDDLLAIQGSCWFANRLFYQKTVGQLYQGKYKGQGAENLEIVLKYWFNGGEVKVNKNTWYAHLFKNAKYYKKYNIKRNGKINSYINGHKLITGDYEKEIKILIKRFWPVPGWPKEYGED